MCGRITLRTNLREIADVFDAPMPLFDTVPRYNVSPGQFVPAIRGAQNRVIVQRNGA
jgi:putative SOS response-associated peptidase YedK